MTVEQLPLWSPGPEPVGLKPGKAESAGRRLTRRQHELAEAGGHPLTIALNWPLKVHPRAGIEGRRCGNCTFRDMLAHPDHNRARPRCLIEKGPYAETSSRGPYPRVSFGDGTQIRAWWPACVDHEWGDNQLSPDAARSGPATPDM